MCTGTDWVREVVLAAAPRRDHSMDHLMHLCGCQYGMTMHCIGGSKMLQHKNCKALRVESPECVLRIERPRQVDERIPVWLIGFPHVWMCPCGCHTCPEVALAVDPAMDQMSLFDAAAV